VTNVPSEVPPPRGVLPDLFNGPLDPAIGEYMRSAAEAVERFAGKWSGRTDYCGYPSILRKAFDELESLEREYGVEPELGEHIYGKDALFYLQLAWMSDVTDEDVKAAKARVLREGKELDDKLRFFRVNLGQISPEYQEMMLAAPELEPYRYELTRAFELGPYQLSDDAIKMLHALEPQANTDWSEHLSDLAFSTEVLLTIGGETKSYPLPALKMQTRSADPEVSGAANAAYGATMRGLARTATAEINAVMRTAHAVAFQSGYASVLERTCAHDDVNPKTITDMAEAVRLGFPTVQQYYRIKAAVTGVDGFDFLSRNVINGLPSYTWPEVYATVRAAFESLDPWTARKIDLALAERRIDALPRAGKIGRTSCSGWMGLKPYVNMHFTGSPMETVQFGHEAGHLVSYLLMQQNCNALEYGSPRIVGEVYGIVCGLLTSDLLIASAKNEQTRLALMMQQLEDDIAGISYQVALLLMEISMYEEIELHERVKLDRINELFRINMTALLGDIDFPNSSELWWVNAQHLRKQLHVGAYGFAGLIARIIHARLKADPAFKAIFMQSMGAGKSRGPADLMAFLGIDISQPAIWYDAVSQWDQSVQEFHDLARKLGKI
jgi:oligoendopeptidase F